MAKVIFKAVNKQAQLMKWENLPRVYLPQKNVHNISTHESSYSSVHYSQTVLYIFLAWDSVRWITLNTAANQILTPYALHNRLTGNITKKTYFYYTIIIRHKKHNTIQSIKQKRTYAT